MDLQSEYAQQQAGGQSADPSQQQAQPQDLTIPAAAVAQITQLIQQQDCANVCKMVAQLIANAAQGGDNDADDSQQ
jgi:hypothetical protein